MSNPFFEPQSDSGIPAFDQIKFEHYVEAFDRGFEEHEAEIEAIASNPEPATFANTLEAMERSGSQLSRVVAVFWNLTSTDTDEQLQALELEIQPRYANHQGGIYSNPELFARVKAIKEGGEELDAEQIQLLDETYRTFVRAGAELSGSERDRVNAINERLAV